MIQTIRRQLEAAIATKQRSLVLVDRIAESAEVLIAALKRGNKILVCGNGGSAADAQHLAAELIGRFEIERPGLACLALTTDSSVLTAWSNDYGFDAVFARQVAALGAAGDVLVGITTSGASPNIVSALVTAGEKGMARIVLTGKDGGRVAEMPGVCSLIVPATETSRIQEIHITIIHIWAALLDEAFRP